MTKKVLVVYATNAGSTADVARLVKTGLENKVIVVDLKPVAEVASVESYDAVIVGAPMIMGWQRNAKRFVKTHQAELSNIPVAYFLTAMALTENRTTMIDGIPIQIDPGLAKPPYNPKRVSFKELYAMPQNYVRPILRTSTRVKPLAVGLFGGYLNLFTLSWPARLFVLLVIQAKPGDLRDEAFIKQWAINLREGLIKSWLK